MSIQSKAFASDRIDLIGNVAGSSRDDTYLWERGNGNVKLTELAGGGVDTLSFGAHIKPGAIQFGRINNDLQIRIANSATAADGGTITLVGYFASAKGSIENILLPGSATPLSRADIEGIVRVMTGSDEPAVAQAFAAGAGALTGAGGSDVLQGFAGGADALTGGAGDDIYKWSRGDGNDRLVEVAGGGVDTLELGPGIAASDLSFARSGSDLLIRIAGANGGILTVTGFYLGNGAGVENVRFGAAGAAQTIASLIGESNFVAMSGTSGADVLRGFAGNGDVLTGGAGNDTYRWSRGDGNDRLVEVAKGGDDTLELGAGITAGDLIFVRMGADLQVRVGGANGGIITLAGQYNAGAGVGVETVLFADGSRLRLADKMGQAILMGGTSASEEIVGLAGVNDVLTGAGGDDTYRWRRGDGNDRIVEAAGGGSDRLVFAQGITASDLTFVRIGADLQLRIGGANGGAITLAGQYNAGAGVETIDFADGSRMRVADLLSGSVLMGGTDADETLHGLAGSSDVLTGGAGNDTYRWNRGDGNDRLVEIARGGTDTLAFGDGVKASDLTFVVMGTDLQIRVAGANGGTITLSGQYNVNAGLEFVSFADGSQASLAEIARTAVVLVGTEDDDTLSGFAGANDALTGGAGNDTYLWSRGDGNDRIVEAAQGGADTLRLGAGIAASDLKIVRVNQDLQIRIAGANGGTVTIANHFAGGETGLEAISFSDAEGTTWSRDAIDRLSRIITGSAANETLSGFASDDTMAGGAGNDRLSGGLGDDAYVWNRGDDNDTIVEAGSGVDRILFGERILSSQVSATRVGNDLVLTIAGADGEPGGSIRIAGQYVAEGAGVEVIEFAAGVVWRVKAEGLDITGSEGAERLIGSRGNDTFTARGGEDYLQGGDGDDVYRLTGTSNVTLVEYGAGGHDRIEMAAGITSGMARLVARGSDLLIKIDNGQGEDNPTVITVTDQFSADQSGIEQIVFGDGSRWGVDEFRNAGSEIFGSVSRDLQVGGASNDTLFGSAGSDTLKGQAGDDDYVWSRGDGDDVIDEQNFADGMDRLRLRGLSASDVRLVRDDRDLKIIIAGEGGGTIRVVGQFPDDEFGIDAIVFDDGQELDWWAINYANPDPEIGSDAAEVLEGLDSNDQLIGLGGDDTLRGASGDDFYKWSRGDGNDVIDEQDFTDGMDRVVLRSGLTASDVSLARDGLDLKIIVAGEGGATIRVVGQFRGEGYGVEAIVFDDGQVLGWSDINATADSEIIGSDADEVLEGFDSNETLIGLAGRDTLQGGGGDDDYVWSRGDGDDVIDEQDFTDGMDRVRLRSGLSASDVRLARDGLDLKIIVAGEGGGTIRVVGQFRGEGYGIEAIVFDDGQQWGWWDINFGGGAEIIGSNAGEVLEGFDSDDTLIGLAGRDSLQGGAGDDDYVWSRGDGNDVIDEAGNADASDRLRLGSGLTASDIRFVRHGDDLKIIVSGANGGTLFVRGQYQDQFTGIESIVFDDGQVLNLDDIPAPDAEVVGSNGAGVHEGFEGNDTLMGLAGNDTLRGGAGNDDYVWSRGDGDDVIEEAGNADASDRLRLNSSLRATDIRLVRQGDDLKIIVTGANGGTLSVLGQFQGPFTGIESIVFGNGERLTLGDIAKAGAEIIGSAEAEVQIGFNTADTLIGLAGNDTLRGGAGNDDYVWSRGDGDDVIDEAGNSDSLDRLRLGSGLSASDLRLVRQGDDLKIIVSGANGGALTVRGQYSGQFTGIESIVFDNGQMITREDMAAAGVEIIGSAGAEVQDGSTGADTLIGLAGNDTLQGGSGNDDYVWSRGDGDDVIDEAGNSDSLDRLRLGSGLSASDVRLFRQGDDLKIVVSGANGGALTVRGQYLGQFTGIESIVFDNGQMISREDMAAAGVEIIGSAGAEVQVGSTGADTLIGLAGNDTLQGGSGNDYYVWSRGDGDDVIEESFTSDIFDRLRLGSGLTASDVRLVRQGPHLKIIISGEDGGTLTVRGQYRIKSMGIEAIVFDNGQVITREDMANAGAEVMGVAQDEVVNGFNGSDTLIGLTGNDTLRGGFGNDDYVWSRGDGDDVIDEAGKSDSLDRLRLGSGLTASDIRLVRQGDDLKIIVSGANGGVLTVRGQYSGQFTGIESIVFDNGQALTLNDIAKAEAGILGSFGAEVLVGFNTADTLIGLAGNDTLRGGSGSDDYVWSRGDGDDVIDEVGYHDYIDRLRFGPGVKSSDVRLFRQGDDLKIIVSGENGGTILVRGQFTSYRIGVEAIVFDGGQAFALNEILGAGLEVVGTEFDDTLGGSVGNDTISGGAGNDYLIGGGGDDIYVWNLGDGNDTVENWWGADTLDINVDPTSVTMFREGHDLVIQIASTHGDGGTILIKNFDYVDHGVNAVAFADGTVWNATKLENVGYIINGVSGFEAVYGSRFNDTIDGGSGNDTIFGRDGDDLYLIGSGAYVEITENEQNGYDRLVMKAGISSETTRLTRSGADLMIAYINSKGEAASVRVVNQFLNETPRIEEISFANGVVWQKSMMDLQLLYVDGTNGRDTLLGSAGNDTINGMAGSDLLIGGVGNDTYRWNLGDGADRIEDISGIDRLLLGAGIDPSQVSLVRSGNDLLVQINGSGSANASLTIADQFAGKGIEAIQFADGSTWSADALAKPGLALSATSASVVNGTNGNDTLAGLSSGATLAGGGGDDLYTYSDVNGIIEIRDGSGSDTLFLTGAFSVFSMTLIREGNDLVIVNGSGRGQIWIKDQYANAGGRVVEALEFDQFRTSINLSALSLPAPGYYVQASTLLPSRMIRNGSNSDDWFAGSSASEAIYGFDGNDSYYITSNGGRDYITDTKGAADRIYVMQVKTTDVTLSSANGVGYLDFGPLVRGIGTAGWTRFTGIEAIQFDDGIVWNTANMKDVTGTYGNDTIVSRNSGNMRDENLAGGSGNDTYVFRGDFGHDAVIEWAGQGSDKLVFSSYLLNQMTFRRMGYDLLISLAGSNSDVTVSGQFFGNGWGIESLSALDGALDRAAIMAMAAPEGVIPGTIYADSLVGTASNETITGGIGADTMVGGAGNDDYVWNRGDGNDLIVETSQLDVDTLRLNVDSEDVSIGSNGAQLQFFIRQAGSSAVEVISVTQSGTGYYDGIDRVAFADGTVWQLSAPLPRSMGDALEGTDEDETFTSTSGADWFGGRGGDDTYIVRPGGYFDTIEDSAGSNDRLVLKGIQSSLVTLMDNGFFASLQFGTSTNSSQLGSVDIDHQNLGGIEQVVFDDGVRWLWNGSDLSGVAGTAGNDTIYSRNTGNVRDEVISGNGGNDLFVFRAGFGQDRITDFAADGAGRDTIDFSTSLFADWSSVLAKSKQVGSDVVISASSGNTITLSNVALSSLSERNFSFT